MNTLEEQLEASSDSERSGNTGEDLGLDEGVQGSSVGIKTVGLTQKNLSTGRQKQSQGQNKAPVSFQMAKTYAHAQNNTKSNGVDPLNSADASFGSPMGQTQSQSGRFH